MEEYRIYVVQGAVTDLVTKMIGVHLEQDEAKKVIMTEVVGIHSVSNALSKLWH